MWGELCCCLTEFLYYSYCRKSTGRKFFVPARTLIAVKLLNIKFPKLQKIPEYEKIDYRRTRGIGLMGLSPFCEKVWIVHTLHFPFLLHSYVKSHLDNDSCLPIYKTIPAICKTPCQTQCVRNSIFPHFVMGIMCCGPSCGL